MTENSDNLSVRLRRLGTHLSALAATHIRLLGLEWQDEMERVLRYLAMLAVAVVCGSIGLVLLALLIVVLYWDTHRIAATLAVAAVFLMSAALIAFGIWRKLRMSPLPFTRLAEEVERDGELFGQDDANE